MDLFKSDLPFDIPSADGYEIHSLSELDGYRIIVPDGELIYIRNFFRSEERRVGKECPV